MTMLAKLFIQERKHDFWEMLIHDIITVYLISGCFLMNIMDMGATVALLHDVSDILLLAARVLGETNFSTATSIVFVLE